MDRSEPVSLPWAQGVGRSNRPAPTNVVTHLQIPLERTQKLSVHFPPAGTLCRPGYLPSCARFTPLMIVESGSKHMNSRSCPFGPAASQMVTSVYLGPKRVSTVFPPSSLQ